MLHSHIKSLVFFWWPSELGDLSYRINIYSLQKFFQKGNLLKHAVVHNPNAKVILTCDHCNKNFTSRDYLAQHMLEHTQGRIHLCHLCDKGFVKVRCVAIFEVYTVVYLRIQIVWDVTLWCWVRGCWHFLSSRAKGFKKSGWETGWDV